MPANTCIHKPSPTFRRCWQPIAVNTWGHAAMTRDYAQMGQRADSERLLQEMLAGCGNRGGCPLEIASIYSSLGEKNQAFAWLEKAYQDRDGGLILLNASLPLIRLRSDARYADLSRRVGLSPIRSDGMQQLDHLAKEFAHFTEPSATHDPMPLFHRLAALCRLGHISARTCALPALSYPFTRGAPAAEPSVIRIGRTFVLLDGIAPIDHNHLSGDVGCGFASEEPDSSGNFLRTPGAADRRILATDDFLLG
jgi:hypothetical protein